MFKKPELAWQKRDLTETTVRGEWVFRGRLLQVRRDVVSMPDGAQTEREYIEHPGAVMVVPLLDNGELVMERQYRYPLGRVLLEFPAGKIDPGEPVLACARRELAEETGYRAAEWARAGRFHNACAYSSEAIEVWFARGLREGAQRLDHGEHLDIVLVTEAELDTMCRRGEATDAKTLIGLLWLRRWREGGWALPWQPEAGPGGADNP